MRIWHRRSLKPDLNENRIVTKRICVEEQEDEDYGDDGEDICSSGRYFPNLLKSDEDYEQERSRNRRPKKNLNNSWPPASSSTLQTYEFDEEVSNEDDKLFEDSHHYSQSYYHSSTIGWRAVPRAQSRSISSPRRRKRSLVDYEQTTLDGGQNGFFKAFSFLFICLVLLLIFLYYFYPYSYDYLTPDQKSRNFRSELAQYLTKEFDTNFNDLSYKILFYVASKLAQRDEITCSNRRLSPLTLLIADSYSGKANILSRNFSFILQNNWPYRFMEQRLDSNNTRTHLDKSILAPIIDEKHSSTFVLSLEGLEKLIDNAPLFLHSLADPDFSPLIFTQHNVLIIGTLHLLDNKQIHDEDSGTMSCDERIEKSLLRSWRSVALSDDQIYPIIARIGAHSICLD
ncbi:hypothetical protein Mgra_00009159 [Meloidogyne graminicola]|uniref:Uncharacterized protein n=1 Tax=Meloidogyne graminicola TaxID=189291 RepID=A0A8S9ZDT0_9BILA|nr:hypothetical protein Mgra_00009159 [Meloidogyne graminicola]